MWLMIKSAIKPIFNFFRNVRVMCCSKGSNIMPSCEIVNSHIGNNVYLHNQVIVFNSNIGSYTYIQRFSTIGNAIVGRYCSIAEGVKVGLGVHPVSEMISTHPFCYGKNKDYWLHRNISPAKNFDVVDESEPVLIGNDVNIGAGAIILNGVVIGDGVIIGAGAVVTKNIPPYAIVAGVPARIIRYRFNETEIARLCKLKWWEWNIQTLGKSIESFSSLNFIEDEQNERRKNDKH